MFGAMSLSVFYENTWWSNCCLVPAAPKSMILYEAFEIVFGHETELFPYFFDEERSDVLYFSLRHRLKSLQTSATSLSHCKGELRADENPKRQWLTLEISEGKTTTDLCGVQINTLINELQFTFQTTISRVEVSHLRDGMDFSPFKKTQGPFAFICLLGMKREVQSIHSFLAFAVLQPHFSACRSV